MVSIAQAAAPAWIGGGSNGSTQCAPQPSDAKGANYEQWVSDYTKGPLAGGLNEGDPIEFALTVLDGDDLKPTGALAEICGNMCCSTRTTTSVSSHGFAAMARATAWGFQGGGPDRLPADTFHALQDLIAGLRAQPPDDHAVLPPPGRRLVFQAMQGSGILVRVYDRANLPERVAEILALAGATHGPMTLDFQAETAETMPEATRQPVDSPPGLPSGAVAYYPSGDRKRAVVVYRSGEVNLWDETLGSAVSRLDLDGELQHVSFSPDGSRVAVTSVRQDKDQSSTFHLRIWDAATGKFLRELRPLYYFENDGFGQPMWWGNGKYLLAENRESHWGSFITGIWNTETGMLRGEFSGSGYAYECPSVIVGDRLFEKYPDGKVQSWDVGAAVEKIEDFERSLRMP